MNPTWTHAELTPLERDQLRQILDGEYPAINQAEALADATRHNSRVLGKDTGSRTKPTKAKAGMTLFDAS